jgi:D-amino-acid oxidase
MAGQTSFHSGDLAVAERPNIFRALEPGDADADADAAASRRTLARNGPRLAPLRTAIVGGGIIGLSVARVLVELGIEVVIYHDTPLLETTSAKAAGLIEPVAASESPLAQAIILDSFAHSFRFWSLLTKTHPHLASMRHVTGYRRSSGVSATWANIVDDYKILSTAEVRERMPQMSWAETFDTPVVNPKSYIAFTVGELRGAGVKFVQRHLQSPSELAHGGFDAVVNATGIGAATFVGDESVYRCDGHVITVPRPAGFNEVIFDWDYAKGADDPLDFRYAITRTNDVVLGGTLREGATIADGEPALEVGMPERLIDAFTDLVPTLSGPALTYEAGSRPMRAIPCIGVDFLHDKTPLVHVYGTGGSGWTLAPGLAQQAVEMLAAHVRVPYRATAAA